MAKQQHKGIFTQTALIKLSLLSFMPQSKFQKVNLLKTAVTHKQDILEKGRKKKSPFKTKAELKLKYYI